MNTRASVFRFGSDSLPPCCVWCKGSDGSLFAGLTNRGWSSLGSDSYGLQRLVWTGRTPFEIQEVRAQPDGFELVFTLPVDPVTAGDPDSYELSSFTYLYHSTYGSDEIQNQQLTVQSAVVSADRMRVMLTIDGLRELFVHQIVADGVRDQNRPITATSRCLLHTQSNPSGA